MEERRGGKKSEGRGETGGGKLRRMSGGSEKKKHGNETERDESESRMKRREKT